MKQYKMSESDFNQMMSEKSYQVRQISIEPGPSETMTYKTGVKKFITYQNAVVEGVEIPNFRAIERTEDVYRDENIKSNLVTFEFVNEDDENEYDENNS